MQATQEPTKSQRLLQPSVAGALAVVAAAALVLLLVVRVVAATNSAQQAQSGAVGHIAPDFTLSVANISGSQPVHLAALRGKPIVLNFWAPWCDPCESEAATLQASWQKYGPKGVVFVGVAFQTNNADIAGFVKQYHISYPTGLDSSGKIAVAYGATALPVTVFIDADGAIVKKETGQLQAATFNQDVQALLWSAAS